MKIILFWITFLFCEGFIHATVNHSLHFKDPITEVHTNSIESSWRHAKVSLPPYKTSKQFFGGYLAKFMFLKRCRALKLDPTMEFFKLAGSLYDPRNSQTSTDLDSLFNEEANISDNEIDLDLDFQ
jgi:hypothetical protein